MALTEKAKARWRNADRLEDEFGVTVVANECLDDDYELRVAGLTEGDIRKIMALDDVYEIVLRANAKIGIREEAETRP